MSENPNITFPQDPIGPPIYIGPIIKPSTGEDSSVDMGVHFAHNLPDLVATETTDAVQLSIAIDDAIIVDAMTLMPDKNRRITIPVRQFARTLESLARPESVIAVLPTIRVDLRFANSSKATYTYHVIPGGIAARREMFDFLLANFLTSQPQIIETTPEQPQWLAFVRPQTDDNIVTRETLESTLYAADGRRFTKRIAETPEAYAYSQVDTSFRTLWQEFCREKNLSPVAYDVYGSSVVSRSGIAAPEPGRPIAQRYLLRPSQPDDQCFGFVNGMGGFDTLMMQGTSVLKPEGENETFTCNEVEKELTNGYTSYWEVSTGYIDTERMAAQYQDFIKSTNRWHCHRGVWRRIVVDEYKVEHTPRELNAYTFKYHLAERSEYRDVERTGLPKVELPTIL